MNNQKVKRVVIAGGGTAGWCAATALSSLIGGLLDITLIESDEIGIVGVGEATIPTIKAFHNFTGVNEKEFIKATNGTFKLGIAFENWGNIGDRYIHSFGEIGRSPWMAPFHHIWMAAHEQGIAGDLGDYCLELQAAEKGKFYTGEGSKLNYAYHFDSGLYGKFLRAHSEKKGVKRIEGKIQKIETDPLTGYITALNLERGERIEGDLFIDCTGFRGLLIEETLKTGYEDWSHYLPTNSALAVQTESFGDLDPYTRAIAHDAGWRWRIPLQNRVGNGLVYCNEYLSDDEAHSRLLRMLDAKSITEPRLIRYKTGKRLKNWNKNCIAIGLSSGFIEPLESTSIHLFQINMTRLVQLFPFDGINETLINRYNDLAEKELEKIRDFVILHYKLNNRKEKFWLDRASMPVPDTLTERMELFQETGHAYQASDDLFRVDSWLQVMLGQGAKPKAKHYVGHLFDKNALKQDLLNMKNYINNSVAAMPSHKEFLKTYS